MSIVKINAIQVPADQAEEFERRFAARAGSVSQSPGFEAFELMKPADGRETYLVYTRWASEEAFQGWLQGPAFAQAHAHLTEGAEAGAGGGHPHGAGGHPHGAGGGHPHGAGGGHPHGAGAGPVGTQSELWSFDVVQSESAPSA